MPVISVSSLCVRSSSSGFRIAGIDALVQIAVRADLDPGAGNVAHEIGADLGVVTGNVEGPWHLLAREHVDEARDAAFGGVAAMRARAVGQLIASALERRSIEIEREADDAAGVARPRVSGALGKRCHRTTSTFQKRGLRPGHGA